jgi:uncharacterized protein YbjQ (UPF0145 family)
VLTRIRREFAVVGSGEYISILRVSLRAGTSGGFLRCGTRGRDNFVIISSGRICEMYQTLGLVVGFASQSEGCNGPVQVEKTYRAALQRLIDSAAAMRANGLIYVNFQNRVASQTGCNGTKQVFEVFAWGTAVRL